MPLEELNHDSPRTVSHSKTIGSSSNTSTSTCQDPVAGAADFTYAPALQEPDGPSLDEFLGNSSEQKHVQGAVSSLEKLLDTSTSYEESNIVNPRTAMQNTIDGSPRTFPSRSEKFVAGPADSTSVLTPQEPDVSSSDEYLDSSSEELITASPRTLPHNTIHGSPPTLGPNILVYHPANSFENLAHELEDLLRKQKIYENHRWYFHFNFTTKRKEVDDDQSTGKKLFFAEVSHMQGKSDWEVNCCRMIEFEAKGSHCLGCKNNGSPDMQHPVETDAYTGGHLDGYLPFGCYYVEDEDEEEEEEEEEDDDDGEDEEKEEFVVYGRRVSFKPDVWQLLQETKGAVLPMDARKSSKPLPAS